MRAVTAEDGGQRDASIKVGNDEEQKKLTSGTSPMSWATQNNISVSFGVRFTRPAGVADAVAASLGAMMLG